MNIKAMPVIVQFFKDMSPTRLVITSLGILLFISLLFFALSRISTKDLVLLYSDLELADSNKIINELESKGITYQLSDNGTTIKVPKDHVAKLRVSLAQVGIPGSASVIGYEIFDKEDSLSTTNFSQNIKMLRALEGEIARTIESFDQVDKVRVHLVLPRKEIFSKEKLEPRASIVIKFKNNKTFNKKEVEAVSNFVVTAVPELTLKRITIIDSKGKSLKLGIEEDDADISGSKNEEYKIAYEDRLKKIIEDLLEQSLGIGKARANVAIDMNFDRTVINSEVYDPDSAIARSVQTSDKRESTPVGSEDNVDLSVANNIPGGMIGEGGGNQNLSISEENEQITNYEISRTVKNQIIETGKINKLSIGIVVDGKYKLDENNKIIEYIPRTKDEIDQITNLIKVAVGFSEDRNDQIEVVNMQFMNNLDLMDHENDNWLRDELPNLFQTVVFAVVVLLILITVVRPITLKVFESKRSYFDATEATAISTDIDSIGAVNKNTNIDNATKEEIDLSKSDNNSKKINYMASFYPQEVLSIFRKWLDEGK